MRLTYCNWLKFKCVNLGINLFQAKGITDTLGVSLRQAKVDFTEAYSGPSRTSKMKLFV